MSKKTLRLILGDQLSTDISSLSDIDPAHDIILMCEVVEEATYVKHHKKKIAFLFAAMRHFAEGLRIRSYNVAYTKLDDPDNAGSFSGEVERAVKKYKPGRIVITEPGEYRVMEMIKTWKKRFSIDVEIRDDDRFLCSRDEFSRWADGRKGLRMEFFYREMRRKYDILMDGDEPVGGQWNYDRENRKPPKESLDIPAPYIGQTDQVTQDCIDLVAERFSDHFGELDRFYFAVTRDQALYALDKFTKERLPCFGDYQDAMIEGEPWMYHSHISFYLNCGLLTPMEAVRKAEEACKKGDVPLNAAEGFIRQIIGWREFVRGIYWLKMPDYAAQNFFEAGRRLPDFYWTGDTDMNCLKQCVEETKQNAYAHHIQRLMVLGNFALLAGLSPEEVNEWFLIVYADAYEWVEMPNVSGMILYADGGYLASKPYAAGGAYINRMSNYCSNCRYKASKKNGKDACPFNYLYWDFLIRNKGKLSKNQRLSMIYKSYEKMSDDKIKAIEEDSERFFKALDNGEKV